MPGSRDQSSRKLIDDLKETLRQYFMGIKCFSLSDSVIEATDVVYSLPMTTSAYGGVLIQQNVFCMSSPLITFPEPVLLDSNPKPVVKKESLIITQSVTHSVESILKEDISILQEQPVVSDIACKSTISKTFVFSCQVQKNYLQTINSPKTTVFAKQKIVLCNSVSIRRLLSERFIKPQTTQIGRLKAFSHSFSASRCQMPIHRKPIPPHRFSNTSRARFRELIATKANISIKDVKLISIYDRIFLNFYKSLSQTEDGTLLCLPKSEGELKKEKNQIGTPFYLIIGQSVQAADTFLQVVIPMAELNYEP